LLLLETMHGHCEFVSAKVDEFSPFAGRLLICTFLHPMENVV
jgi:hypothetical protein